MAQRPLWIGTAGWSVPARYAADVPSGGSQLERYARALNAAEINSSFYRPHQRKTYERWAVSTPEAFCFSVKMPRTISHFARLKDCDAMLDRFLDEVSGLGDKLGALLVQLPPKLAFDEQAAGGFFRDVQSRIATPIALEPRNASWFAPGMDEWLAEQRITRVAADPARLPESDEPGGWNGLIYYLYLWTALPLQVDFEVIREARCIHLSGVTRRGRGAQMGNPLAHASTTGRSRGP